MSREEQKQEKEKSFEEALRYLSNAYHNLDKAGKEDKFYKDKKYVKSACGIAYSGVLVALDAYLRMKDIPKPKNRPSREYYQGHLAKLDKKLLGSYNIVYQILHLVGYYDGFTHIPTIQTGFEQAQFIIQKLKQ